MNSYSFLASLLLPVVAVFDDPPSAVPVDASTEIPCGEERTPLQAGVGGEEGKIKVPSGSLMSSSILLSLIAEDYQGDYYCGPCDGGVCHIGSLESSGTFSFVLVSTGINYDVYEWSSGDVEVIIDCSDC